MIKLLGFGVRIPGFEFEFLFFHLSVCVCVCVCMRERERETERQTLNILLNFSELQFLICKTHIIFIVIIIIGNISLVLVMFPAVF